MASSATISVGSTKATLPILQGQENFRRWYEAWHIVFRGAKLWLVISGSDGKETRPIQWKDEKYDDYLIRLRKIR